MQRSIRYGIAWLELLLVLAFLVLLFQFFPLLWFGIIWALDIRNWPRTMWFAANGVVLLALVAIRFAPELYNDWIDRRQRRVAERTRQRKQAELKERRETLERLKRGRERRIY